MNTEQKIDAVVAHQTARQKYLEAEYDYKTARNTQGKICQLSYLRKYRASLAKYGSAYKTYVETMLWLK